VGVLRYSSRSALNCATYPDLSIRAPITVGRLLPTAALSASASAASLSPVQPSAPTPCAIFSQSMPPRPMPYVSIPLISCLTRIRPIS
jgi:hypothetical protein